MISFWGKHMLHFSHIFEDYKAVLLPKKCGVCPYDLFYAFLILFGIFQDLNVGGVFCSCGSTPKNKS